jgi:hypothetical protein
MQHKRTILSTRRGNSTAGWSKSPLTLSLSPFSSGADSFIFFSATASKTGDLLAAALECGSMMPLWSAAARRRFGVRRQDAAVGAAWHCK